MAESSRTHLIGTWVVGGAIALSITWAAWESHVKNDRMYLSPAEQVHERERQFHVALGELHGKVDRYHDEVTVLKLEMPKMAKHVGEAHGRVDIMREYFQKYSPESFEKETKSFRRQAESFEKEVVDLQSEVDQATRVISSFVSKHNYLPTSWEWNQQQSQLKAKLAGLDALITTTSELKKTLKELEKKLDTVSKEETKDPVPKKETKGPVPEKKTPEDVPD